MERSTAQPDARFNTGQLTVQDFFDGTISESDPVRGNIAAFLGEVMRRLPGENGHWLALLEPVTHILLECQRRNPKVFEEAKVRNTFVEEGGVESLVSTVFASGRPGVRVEVVLEEEIPTSRVRRRGTANSVFQPKSPPRSWTGGFFKSRKHQA
ncbi:hypothetical protein BDW59DRAFT_153479 [Aspergillus cavernicola]|uniref:Uncharacterized protein n=1 Tax=Aspergillus cavernicola TaxID=176166 RepID=A0ABR4HMW3_9EURO